MPAPYSHDLPVIEFQRSFDTKRQPLIVTLAQYVFMNTEGKRVTIGLSDEQLELFFASIEQMRSMWEARRAES